MKAKKNQVPLQAEEEASVEVMVMHKKSNGFKEIKRVKSLFSSGKNTVRDPSRSTLFLRFKSSKSGPEVMKALNRSNTDKIKKAKYMKFQCHQLFNLVEVYALLRIA
ncbi:Uncharacterized protein Fot_43136 [Forsythia ovata]|uniref:Uncharacterized protein n=1 Tax=Forsythia ovata TaxID=205694 RepID=A0ABD1RN59_9LAMI